MSAYLSNTGTHTNIENIVRSSYDETDELEKSKQPMKLNVI